MTEDANVRRQDEVARERGQRHPVVARARFEARSMAGQFRWYVSYLRRKHRALGWGNSNTSLAGIVDASTDVVIDAFPRCGNTFALTAFVYAQGPARCRVGHHVCYPAQVLSAIDLGIPTLVIAREPRAAVASSVQWNPLFSTRQWLRIYTRYYRRVAGAARRSGAVVVADFSEVTTDFGLVMARINKRFGTDFELFDHTPPHVQACHDLIEAQDAARFGSVVEARVSRPSSERRLVAVRLASEFEGSRHRRRLVRAERAYRAALDATSA